MLDLFLPDKKIFYQLEVVMYAYNPHIQEVEAGGFECEANLGCIASQILSQNTKQMKTFFRITIRCGVGTQTEKEINERD